MIKVYRRLTSFLVAFPLLWLVGCASVPQQQFDGYLKSYGLVRSTTQDIMLHAKIAAEQVSQDPSNPDTAMEKHRKLQQRESDIETRQQMLDLIDQYNQVLVSLATGADPKAVETDLTDITQGLQSLHPEKLSGFAGKVNPYLAVVSEAIGLIDTALKNKAFAKAINAAQKPMSEILGILEEDASSISEVIEARLALKQHPVYFSTTRLRLRLESLANSSKGDADVEAEIGNALAGANASIAQARWIRPPSTALTALMYTPGPSASPIDASVLETMRLAKDELQSKVSEANQMADENAAQKQLITEYRNSLIATKSAFRDLNMSIESGRRLATISFLTSARKLRKAYLELQEAKTP
jgi:hypothetical protein